MLMLIANTTKIVLFYILDLNVFRRIDKGIKRVNSVCLARHLEQAP